jgi:hypothetical protein
MRKNVFNFISRFRGIVFSVALIVLLASCNDDDAFVSEPVDVAYVSIYHASPDAPDFSILVDGRTINQSPFDYSSYSGYLNFFTGDRAIRFAAYNAGNALIDTTFNFESQKAYSLFAVDRLDKIEALLVVDSAGSPSPEKAMVRFVHLAPDAAAFDLFTPASEDPLFASREFRQASDFQEIDADTYNFQLRKTGESAEVLTTEDVDILPGRYYTIITRGFVDPPAGNTNILSIEVLGS